MDFCNISDKVTRVRLRLVQFCQLFFMLLHQVSDSRVIENGFFDVSHICLYIFHVPI